MTAYDIGWDHASQGNLPLSREDCESLFIDYDDYMMGYDDAKRDA